MSARAREKMRRSRPIHVERTPIRLGFKLADGSVAEAQARVVLSELTVDGVVLYSAEPLAPNTEVKLTIENPEKFEIEAKIVWCQYQDSSARIITTNAFPYRMGVAFRWAKDEDKEKFDRFVKTARHHYDSVVNPAPVSNEVLVEAPKGDAKVTDVPPATAPAAPAAEATTQASVTPISEVKPAETKDAASDTPAAAKAA